jgi:hypothetical protein
MVASENLGGGQESVGDLASLAKNKKGRPMGGPF